MAQQLETREFTHFHFFCGLGGGAKGFNAGSARLGNQQATFRCIGGIDVDPSSIADFERLAGVKGTVLDLFSLEQYMSFHGKVPPKDWKEAGIADVHAAAGHERPNIVFLSAPCKGFSGLLSETTSLTMKYQALNQLTLRGVWLMLEAWKNDPPELIVFENVPRIMTRGRSLLDQIVKTLRHYGYAVAETTHDCGEIGGLAQRRKRFLLVARHEKKVPPFLYEPIKQRLRGVGEVLDLMPLPGDPMGGPMHRVPSLQWKTWVRLAFVEAGSDWRSLNKLNVENGVLSDFGIMPDLRSAALGVNTWSDPMGAVIGESFPSNGKFAIADPRAPHAAEQYGQYGVTPWGEHSSTLTSQRSPGQGKFSVADPRAFSSREGSGFLGVGEWDSPTGTVTGNGRPGSGAHSVADPRPGRATEDLQGNFYVTPFDRSSRAVVGARKSGASAVADPRSTQGPNTHSNKFRVVPYDQAAGSVIGSDRVGSGAPCVADPRPSQREDYKQTKYRVTGMDEPGGTVIAASTTGNGAFAVADPRPDAMRGERDHYNTQGHYGVVSYDETSGAVPAFAKNCNGSWPVADPRDGAGEFFADDSIILPEPSDRLTCVIRSMDGTWHRPFTTLELAALQSLIDLDDPTTWSLVGNSDSGWRERIGNAVPAKAAAAIASVMGKTLLLAQAGETFMLSSAPVWVQPLAIALAVDTSHVPA